MTANQQLLKGFIDPIILSVLKQLPMYGYQIAKELVRRSTGYLTLKTGTIYPSLIRLEKQGLVTSEWRQNTAHRGRRYYQITKKGHRFLNDRAVEWHNFYNTINGFLEVDKTTQATDGT